MVMAEEQRLCLQLETSLVSEKSQDSSSETSHGPHLECEAGYGMPNLKSSLPSLSRGRRPVGRPGAGHSPPVEPLPWTLHTACHLIYSPCKMGLAVFIS